MIGLGTWQYNDTLAQASLATAFSMGYRHVDTAYGYENQVGVGKALAASGLPLNELFITSKVPGGLNASATTAALDASLVQLGVAQVDLMLLHWAAKTKAARQAQWLALEAWAKQGKARAIGLSHYCKYQTQDVLEVATLPVALNQNQYHVGMGGDTQPRLHDKAFMEQSGILYEAYSSLCGPCDPPDNKALITGPLVSSIGKAHNKTGAQVALRWVVQQGSAPPDAPPSPADQRRARFTRAVRAVPVIPKASNPAYIRDDFALFDFELSDAEMAQLSAATSPAETGTPAAPDDAQDCTAEEPPVVEQERA